MLDKIGRQGQPAQALNESIQIQLYIKINEYE